MRARFLRILLSASLVALASAARAQCPNELPGSLDNGDAAHGVAGTVEAITAWDPVGMAPQLVVAGDFTAAGGVAANNVAMWDSNTGHWQALGAGFDDQVRALAVYNGDLIAAGLFTHSGSTYVGYIARWDGSAWQPMAGGMGSYVYALTVWNGALIAGGYFNNAGGGLAAHIASWDGSSWSSIGGGIDDWVVSLGQWNGQLIAGGYFLHAGGMAANHVAGWNGSTWAPLGAGTNGEVFAFGYYNGSLYVGGRFTAAGGGAANYVARWSGTSWFALGSGTSYAVQAFGNYGTQLAVGGAFTTAGGVSTGDFAFWNGSSWQATPNTADAPNNGSVYALGTFQNELVAGGQFPNPLDGQNLTRWDGSLWTSVGGGLATEVAAATTFLGKAVLAGTFNQSVGGLPAAEGIVTWDGSSLGEIDTGIQGNVYALKSFKYSGIHGSNELIAGGTFSHAGSVAVSNIARVDVNPLLPGEQWVAMGAELAGGQVTSIERFNNVTYAGGSFPVLGAYLASWDETNKMWHAVPGATTGLVSALKVYNGYLYVGGSFTTMGGVGTGGLARWDGSTWSQVGGNFLGTVNALEVHQGQLVMAGEFPGINSSPNLAEWNGTSYSTFETGGTDGAVFALSSTGTQLYVGGILQHAGGVAASEVAMWDGSWHQAGSGIPSPTGHAVYALAPLGSEMNVGGYLFSGMNGAGTFDSPGWIRFPLNGGAPWLTSQPFSQSVTPGSNVTFTSNPAADYPSLSLQWKRNGAPLADGPTGTGSTIGGSHAATLSLGNVSHTDYGDYQMFVTSPCGDDTSVVATLTLSGDTGVPGPGILATALGSVGPNPARGPLRIAFSLAREGDVTVAVHDVAGRVARRFTLGRRTPGAQSLTWDARGEDGAPTAAGVYWVSLEVDGRRIGSRRIALLR